MAAASLFGRTAVAGDQVRCTNPAASHSRRLPRRGSASPTPIAPGARLRGASVLQISPLGGAQTATPSPDPTWGLHLLDANIALGNLVSAVQREAGAYAARPSAPLAPAWRG